MNFTPSRPIATSIANFSSPKNIGTTIKCHSYILVDKDIDNYTLELIFILNFFLVNNIPPPILLLRQADLMNQISKSHGKIFLRSQTTP